MLHIEIMRHAVEKAIVRRLPMHAGNYRTRGFQCRFGIAFPVLRGLKYTISYLLV